MPFLHDSPPLHVSPRLASGAKDAPFARFAPPALNNFRHPWLKQINQVQQRHNECLYSKKEYICRVSAVSGKAFLPQFLKNSRRHS